MPDEGPMRIHKFLAQAGVCSRREAERLVAEGVVQINGKIAVTGQPVDPTIELCCVYHPSCFYADGWATALMASGWTDAQAIAEREHLAVMLVDPKGETWKSTALKGLK